MPDIIALKFNETFTKLICEPSIREELRDFFSFEDPNMKFHPLVRARKWDGITRLYNKSTGNLYTGLLRYLEGFCKERNYSIAIDPRLTLMNNYSLAEANEFIKSLDIRDEKKEPINARDYQVIAFAKAIRYKRMMMVCPTASGKSYIIYCTLRKLLADGQKLGLIVVPTTALVEQLTGDFKAYSAANGWEVEDRVQKLYEGYSSRLEPSTEVVVSTWQSIYELPELLRKFDFVIGDEAHTFSAKCVGSIMENLIHAPYRIGTTGTTHEAEVNNLKLEGYFGPITKITTTKKLMDDGHIAQLTVKSLVLKHPSCAAMMIKLMASDAQSRMSKWTEEGSEGKTNYMAELQYLIGCEARNKFIRNLALSIKGNTIILVQFIEKHGQVIYDLLVESTKDRKIFFVHGGTETEDREAIRAITEKETDAIIVASSVFSTGTNIKNLHNLILASPTKAKIKTLQSIGRILRLSNNKSSATLYDIADDLRCKDMEKTNYTLRHYAKRMLIYYEEKFQVSHYNIELNYTLKKD